MTPELKSPSVVMPFEAGVPAKDVYAQSFNADDVCYWISQNPDFGKQAIYLDGRYDVPDSSSAMLRLCLKQVGTG